ncbi:cytosine permease, partial [Eisenbergiella porci]
APDKPWVVPLLVALAGICMTGSAFFGIRAMTIVSYISVPLIAMLGITAMIMAVRQGDASLAEKFAESQGLGVITGAGMVIGSFVSGGTATPNFARFAKTPKAAVWTTAIAFFLGNSLMFCFGAFSGVYVGGNDIFEVMIALNLTVFAIIVLGLNIWTTNDNALYSAGLGLSNITKIKKSPLVLISGALGTVAAIWLYNNFTGWLNILNCTLPPVGAILILGYFCHKEDYDQDKENTLEVNWFAIAGVILGAVVANVVPVGIASINGMAVAVVCYLVGFAAGRKK